MRIQEANHRLNGPPLMKESCVFFGIQNITLLCDCLGKLVSQTYTGNRGQNKVISFKWNQRMHLMAPLTNKIDFLDSFELWL